MGKKKKKKSVPIYRQGWFTAASVTAVLASLAFVFYLVFLKIPAPEVYEQRAQTLLNSSDFKERKEGRQLIDDFLLHFPDHATVPAMRKLADKYKVNAIPYPVLVGPDGRIVSLRARGPQLERLLARLLKETGVEKDAATRPARAS